MRLCSRRLARCDVAARPPGMQGSTLIRAISSLGVSERVTRTFAFNKMWQSSLPALSDGHCGMSLAPLPPSQCLLHPRPGLSDAFQSMPRIQTYVHGLLSSGMRVSAFHRSGQSLR